MKICFCRDNRTIQCIKSVVCFFFISFCVVIILPITFRYATQNKRYVSEHIWTLCDNQWKETIILLIKCWLQNRASEWNNRIHVVCTTHYLIRLFDTTFLGILSEISLIRIIFNNQTTFIPIIPSFYWNFVIWTWIKIRSL